MQHSYDGLDRPGGLGRGNLLTPLRHRDFRILWLGMAVSLWYFLVIVPLVGLVESVPVSIYGIGLRDVSYVYLLGLVGVSKPQALSLSVVYVVLTVFYALFGGLVFALRGPLAPAQRVGTG